MNREFEELLTSTRAELGRMRAEPGEGPAPQEASGSALDGHIRVTMATDGRVKAIVLHPSVMRMDEQMLARELVTAINTAWAARLGADEAAATVAAVDTGALQERLTEVQDRSLATMRMFTDSLQDLVSRIERGTR
jgi:DNA-binding protein YbaB